MLTELSVTNFKSWQSIAGMRIAPITGVFGTNSSGKSSVFQLLLMLKQTVESSDRSQVLEFGDEKSLTNLGSFRDVVFDHKQPGSIEFTLSWKLDKSLNIKRPEVNAGILFSGDSMCFTCRLGDNGSDKLAVEEFCYGFANHRFSIRRKGQGGSKYELSSEGGDFKFVRTQGRAWDLAPPVKFYGFPDQVYARYQNAGFLAELQLALEQMLAQVFYLGPLREYPQRHYSWKGSEPSDMGRRGERVVDAILAARQRGSYLSPGFKKRRQTLEERIAFWLKELRLIHDFRVKQIADKANLYEVHLQKNAASASVLITDVGFGVSQILPVLVLCYYVPEGSTILLEQPEIHLHPSVQSRLADVFIDVMKNRNVQVLVESHSEHLLTRLQRRIAEQLISPERTSLYFCDAKEASSVLTQLDVDLFGNVRNWPRDFFGDEFGERAAITRAAMQHKKAQSA